MKFELFGNLSLIKPLVRSVKEQGYREPTPIQQEAIPLILAGKDLFGVAQTGTGKTAAFALPMLQVLQNRQASSPRRIRALIVTPTRELALQIEDSFRTYGRYLPLRTACILGGMSISAQVKVLHDGSDFLIATPGRFLDLFQRGHIRLDGVEFFVLDEADRMLDMGFIGDVRRIVSKLPLSRQTMLFSATISREVENLARSMLKLPARIDITPTALVSDHITQKVLFVDRGNKDALLTTILKTENIERALIFARTKHRVDALARQLSRAGIDADSIHSDKTQRSRLHALSAFTRGRIRVLVGTDVVARGIDVDDISHVINYELPDNPEWYVHRIGRTARAGADGIALSLCDADDVMKLKSIEKFTHNTIAPDHQYPYFSSIVAALHDDKPSISAANCRSLTRRSFGPRTLPRRKRGFGRI